MKHLVLGTLTALTLSLALAAQAPPPPIVETGIPDVDRHIAAAKVAAGTYWDGLYTAVCGDAVSLSRPAAPRGGGAGRGAGGGGGRGAGGGGGPRAGGGGAPTGPARETWHADPVKVFDNAYYLGMTEYSVWAITTSQGIILVDAIYDYSIADEVTEGLKKVGLDPAQIKYVIVSHGHLDHAGGAKYLQDTYGAKLIMSAADYDLLDQQNPSWKPKRDMVATDGMQLTLGDTTLTLYLTPGHTLGTISTIIPLRDGTQRHVAAAWGGTRFNFGRNVEQLKMYAASAERFRGIAEKAGADVVFSNHTEFDGSKAKLLALTAAAATKLSRTAAGVGFKNPYVVGPDAAKRYLTVANECAQAAVAGLMANP